MADSTKKDIIAILLVVIAAVVVGWGGYYWRQLEIATVEVEKENATNEVTEKFEKQVNALQKQVAQLQSQKAETTETSTEQSQKIIVADEKALGYITKVYDKDGKRYLDIDYIQWLTGEEAKKAMVADGLCQNVANCIVTNDYHIKNQNSKIRTFEISSDSKIYTQTYNLEATGQIEWDREITYRQFKNLFIDVNIERQKYIPYHISIKDNVVIEIAEQYIP